MRNVKFALGLFLLAFGFIVGIPTVLIVGFGLLGGTPVSESLQDSTLGFAVTLFLFIVVFSVIGGIVSFFWNKFKEKNKTDLEKIKEAATSKVVKNILQNAVICYIGIILILTFFGNTDINSYFCKLDFEEDYWIRVYSTESSESFTSVPATIKMSYFPPFKREIKLIYFYYLEQDYDVYSDEYIIEPGVITRISAKKDVFIELTDKKVK